MCCISCLRFWNGNLIIVDILVPNAHFYAVEMCLLIPKITFDLTKLLSVWFMSLNFEHMVEDMEWQLGWFGLVKKSTLEKLVLGCVFGEHICVFGFSIGKVCLENWPTMPSIAEVVLVQRGMCSGHTSILMWTRSCT